MSKELIVKEEFNILPIEQINNLSELEGVEIVMPQIKIPTGGSTVFEYITDDPENPEVLKEITGVIIKHRFQNVYFKDKYDGTIKMPDCFSNDSKTGYGNPGGDCKRCPLNRYGSGDGGTGKACKNTVKLFVLRNGEMLPIEIIIPPSSLKEYSNYVSRLLMKGNVASQVITKISLAKETNKSGIIYSKLKFSKVRNLEKGELESIEGYKTGIDSVLENRLNTMIAVQEDEFNIEVEE